MIKDFIEKALRWIDNRFKTSLYENVRKLLNSVFMNSIRRNVGFRIVKWKYKIGMKDKVALKLHLGCGGRHFEGYVNIDSRKTSATDFVCDIRKLPYPDDSVELIETYHVIEHFPREDLPKALKEWYRVLVSGGKIVIECPDFDKAVREYIEGNEERIYNIFGHQRFAGDAHLFGYNFERIKKILEAAGFSNIEKGNPQDDHTEKEPCLRVECIKSGKP